ncbi:MAG TPA: hypothetical protein VNZ23_08605 [Xanthobacteraceae bacterium]|nr:hypothetical protein [Xanthobacteraceae bacterium]
MNRGAEITPLEMAMLTEAQRIANTREHLLWAYRVAIFWAVFAILIFGSAYLLADVEQMSEASRTFMFSTLGTIIVTSAVWQAIGFALARLENFGSSEPSGLTANEADSFAGLTKTPRIVRLGGA